MRTRYACLGLFNAFLQSFMSQRHIGLYGQSDLVRYQEMFPEYKQVLLKAYTMAELSELEMKEY